MSARLATIDDYRWLYGNTEYQSDGIKCAREMMSYIVERCPTSFIDCGCGRGHLVDLINRKTTGTAIGFDPAMNDELPSIKASWALSFDVLEHLDLPSIANALGILSKIATQGAIITMANMSDVVQVRGEDVELHTTQMPLRWWHALLLKHFHNCTLHAEEFDGMGHRFGFVVEFAK